MTTDRWWDIVRMRFRSLVKRERVESELDREMRYHLERAKRKRTSPQE